MYSSNKTTLRETAIKTVASHLEIEQITLKDMANLAPRRTPEDLFIRVREGLRALCRMMSLSRVTGNGTLYYGSYGCVLLHVGITCLAANPRDSRPMGERIKDILERWQDDLVQHLEMAGSSSVQENFYAVRRRVLALLTLLERDHNPESFIQVAPRFAEAVLTESAVILTMPNLELGHLQFTDA